MTPDDIAIDGDNFDGVADLIDDPSSDIELPPIAGEDDARRFHRWRHGVLRELERYDAWRDAERARIDLFHSDRTAGFRRRLANIDIQIEAWQRATGVKTFPTPWGTSKLVAPRESVLIYDAEALVKWAVANDELGLLKMEPRKDPLGDMARGPEITEADRPWSDDRVGCALVSADGEVVPGVAIVKPVNPSFSIK